MGKMIIHWNWGCPIVTKRHHPMLLGFLARSQDEPYTQSNQGISEHSTINLYCRQCVPPPTCIIHPRNIPAVFRKCLLSSMCSGRENMEIMRKWQSIYSKGLPTFSITWLLSIDTQLGVAIGFVQKMALTVPF